MMDTLGEEPPVWVVAPIFNSSLNLIIVWKPLSLQSVLEWTEDVVFTERDYVAALAVVSFGGIHKANDDFSMLPHYHTNICRGEKQRKWRHQLDICDSHIDVILGGNRDSDPESQKSRQDDHLSGCALWSLLHACASY
ncbi:hypothetical protein TNCV_3110051 [Trichonephila clavipes]|nr:hypothetical protein TNCV_3110051 [Trichonephila clavipes]